MHSVPRDAVIDTATLVPIGFGHDEHSALLPTVRLGRIDRSASRETSLMGASSPRVSTPWRSRSAVTLRGSANGMKGGHASPCQRWAQEKGFFRPRRRVHE
jgi:hypothetical protein